MIKIKNVLYILLFTFISSFLYATESAKDLGFECTVFNVGQGSGVVIRDKNTGDSLVVDAGHSGTFEETSPLLKRFNSVVFGGTNPYARGNLRAIAVSHSDGDHIKLLTRVVKSSSRALKDQNKAGTPTKVYLGSPFHGYCSGEGQKCLDALIAVNAIIVPLSHRMTREQIINKTIDEKGVLPFFMNALIPEFSDALRELSTTILAANMSHGGECQFLGDVATPGELEHAITTTDTQLKGGTNNNGAVVCLRYKGIKSTLPGDIDGDCTDRIVNATEASFLRTDVSLGLHHGAEHKRTNNTAWLLQTDSKYIVVSAGENKGHCHPSFSTIFDMAALLRLSELRVPFHIIQCGDKGTECKAISNIKLHAHFCLMPGTNIEEHDVDGFKWMRMYTSLPLFTTVTSGDIKIVMNASGELLILKH
jgi:hypothetical protein